MYLLTALRKVLSDLIYSLCIALFLSSLELSVVSTSLVAITNDLHGFSRSSWVVTAYLLTYFGKLHRS